MEIVAQARTFWKDVRACALAWPIGAAAVAAALLLAVFARPALAGPPIHVHDPSLDLAGFNHACGVAIDSSGDIYVSSAGESKIKIFDSAHTEIGSVTDLNEPCGLAVDPAGNLYVSEKTTGKVVEYQPTAFPFVGAPSYGAPITVDGSGLARGISIDPADGRLYVAEGAHIAVYKADDGFESNIGEGTLVEATGVTAYSYAGGRLYVFAADPNGGATDLIDVFSGTTLAGLELKRQVDGSETPDGSLGFGPGGAHIAGDRGYCPSEAEDAAPDQACAAGHFFTYDATHAVVDEFDASGEYVDRVSDPSFADAEPTGIAIDRSGGSGDGTLYVSSGAGAGAVLSAFAPLASPSRPPVGAPLSKELPTASAVAVDSKGFVYVVTGAVIHVYTPAGKEIGVGQKGKGLELPETPTDIAVDSTGKVYVLVTGNGFANPAEYKVQYLVPSAYPPQSGTQYSAPVTVATGNSLEEPRQLTAMGLNPSDDHVFVDGFGRQVVELGSAAEGSPILNPCFACGLIGSDQGIAVYGANGNVYTSENGFASLIIVNSTGTKMVAKVTGITSLKGPFPGSPGQITVDQSNGHVLTFNHHREVAEEFDASGAFVGEFGEFSDVTRPAGIAIDNSAGPSAGNVYVAFDDPSPSRPFDLSAFGPLSYGEPPQVVTGLASGIGAGGAILNGTVDPRGFAVESCFFDYLTDSAYQANLEAKVDPFEGAEEEVCAETSAEIGKGSGPVAVHAGLAGLAPEGRYRFRLVAKGNFGESQGEVGLFGPPNLKIRPASPVLYDEATLRAELDPSGLVTKYRFQYGTTEAYGQETSTAELAPGDGFESIQRSVTGLLEGAEYHFRIVAENAAKTVLGPDQIFVTLARRPAESCSNVEFRTGLSANLPDCRAYELVTPAETRGAGPFASGGGVAGEEFNNLLVAPRGAGAGESVAYFIAGTLPGFDGNGTLDGYRAVRPAGEGPHPKLGWTNQISGPSFSEADGQHPSQHGVSSDQGYWLWQVFNFETLEGSLPSGNYVRDPGAIATKCTPISPSHYELVGCGSLGTDAGARGRFVGPGGAHLIFSSSAKLESQAAPVGTEAIYDRAAGAEGAEVISVKPGDTPFGASENASYVGSSEDGSAVAFRVGGTLYLHHEGATVEVAVAPNEFAGISEDGRRIFYADSDEGPASLFVCDVEAGSCAGSSKAQEPTKIAANSIFANVSPDGSHVFLISKEVLSAGKNENKEVAESGESNLYMWDGGAIVFVAVLAPEDLVSFDGNIKLNLASWTRSVSAGSEIGRAKSPTRSRPNGDVFVFQSHAQLTSYENAGKGEIYRYKPDAAPGARIICVSCDPSRAPATGDATFQELAPPTAATTLIPNVTDDGDAVFFQSPDRLLPEDANSAQDVYEWKAEGVSGCARSGGCLALISSGQGENDSSLFGMSADGHDVFISTQEKLVAADVPGSPSIYDARVDGGIPDPPTPAGCQGDACQGSGAIPPALPSPSSTGSEGGNIRPSNTGCRKGKHRVRGHCVAKHKKHKRNGKGNHKRRQSR